MYKVVIPQTKREKETLYVQAETPICCVAYDPVSELCADLSFQRFHLQLRLVGSWVDWSATK
jgi:hypothetical protein